MSHQVHFKVKSSIPGASTSSAWSTIQWDGPNHITTLDLKRHIAQQLQLTDPSAPPFEFIVTNASTGEEYREDQFIVHKNTSVWVKKVVGSRERADTLRQPPSTGTTVSRDAALPSSASSAGQPDNDDQQLLNVVSQASRARAPSASSSSFAPQTYQRQSHGAGHSFFSPNAKPPPGYVCHRCQQSGHFIRFCPTNGDPAYDGRRPKAAVAVAQYESNAQKFFLRDVEDPKALAAERRPAAGGGRASESGSGPYVTRDTRDLLPSPPVPSGRQYSDDGGLRSSAASRDIRPDLLCPICRRLFRDPTVVPCCFASFCQRCILQSLQTSSLCPRCKQPITESELRPNIGLQKKILQEEEEEMRRLGNGAAAGGGGGYQTYAVRAGYDDWDRDRDRERERDRPDRGGGYGGGAVDRGRSPPRYGGRRGGERDDRRPDYDQERERDRERGGRDSRERDRDDSLPRGKQQQHQQQQQPLSAPLYQQPYVPPSERPYSPLPYAPSDRERDEHRSYATTPAAAAYQSQPPQHYGAAARDDGYRTSSGYDAGRDSSGGSRHY